MIPDEELNALKQKDELLRNRQTEIDSQIALKNKELDQHRAKNLTEKSTQDIAQEAEANQANAIRPPNASAKSTMNWKIIKTNVAIVTSCNDNSNNSWPMLRFGTK